MKKIATPFFVLVTLTSYCGTASEPWFGHEEYDSKILDPMTVFGSPYGGFSRATRSRLSALPLRLPDIAIMDDKEKKEGEGTNPASDSWEDSSMTKFMETNDGLGKSYVCRVYHEDQLDPDTIGDSVFDMPVLNVGDNKDDVEKMPHLHSSSVVEEDVQEEDAIDVKRADGGLIETQRRLRKLEGVCSQIHLGWWSYEWCFEQSVTQFHIHVDSTKSGLELQSVTSLGKFASRKFQMAHQFGTLGDNDEFSPNNKYAEDELELARVVDSYDRGDTCDTTGKPRHTHVKYFCCSERLMDKYKGPVLRNGHPLASKIVSIVNLVEDPDVLCSYTITVCTPLLCEDVKSDDDDGLLFDIVTETSKKKRALAKTAATGSRHSTTKKEHGTIRDLLDLVVGKTCIQSSTASGWWSYEYCHRKHVRQFHESISINLETGLASAGTEDIYMLGFYNEDLDSYPDEDEWKYLTNKTLSPSGTSGDGSTGSTNSGGTQVAAYLSTEYTGGDVCDDSDVTDAAIKAGSVGGGRIERACSVRYMCGGNYDVRVNEDHTCHYIVEVSIPELCDHPLFKAPVAKKRVVKCVPVEDTGEWES